MRTTPICVGCPLWERFKHYPSYGRCKADKLVRYKLALCEIPKKMRRDAIAAADTMKTTLEVYVTT